MIATSECRAPTPDRHPAPAGEAPRFTARPTGRSLRPRAGLFGGMRGARFWSAPRPCSGGTASSSPGSGASRSALRDTPSRPRRIGMQPHLGFSLPIRRMSSDLSSGSSPGPRRGRRTATSWSKTSWWSPAGGSPCSPRPRGLAFNSNQVNFHGGPADRPWDSTKVTVPGRIPDGRTSGSLKPSVLTRRRVQLIIHWSEGVPG